MRMNFGDDAVLPQLVIRRPDAVDRDALVRHVTDLVPLGLKVSTRFMGDQLGIPTPEDDEDLLVTQTAMVDKNLGDAKDKPVQQVAGLSALPNSVEPNAIPPIPPQDYKTDGGVIDLQAEIAAVVAHVLGDYEPVLRPTIQSIETALAQCQDYDQAIAVLSAMTPDTKALAEQLARLTFATRSSTFVTPAGPKKA